MSTLTIRNVDAAVKDRLRVRAAHNGRSVAAELRCIVSAAVDVQPRDDVSLAEAIRRRFAPFGGVDDVVSHPPVPVGDPPRFGR